MKASLYHVQVNVRDRRVSLPFYRALFEALEFRLIQDGPDAAGFSDGRTSLWLLETPAEHRPQGYHRKRTGLNHVAFRVAHREDVDRFAAEFLPPRGIKSLYGTPREFPEYRPGYYAVFFEDPDRVKLEVAHIPEPGER